VSAKRNNFYIRDGLTGSATEGMVASNAQARLNMQRRAKKPQTATLIHEPSNRDAMVPNTVS